MSILHGKAFKKEVRARCKANLIKVLERTPCQQCGHVNPVVFRKKEEGGMIIQSLELGKKNARFRLERKRSMSARAVLLEVNGMTRVDEESDDGA